MLVVKGLDRPRDIVVRTDSFLHVLSIVDVALLDVVILLLVTGRRKTEGENGLGLLELEVHWRFQVLYCKFLLILFGGLEFLLVLVFTLGL